MEKNQFSDYLQHFGLTRQEASVYLMLLLKGKQTGYEIAKETGISRSNAYGALAALVEKGAAYLQEESAKKYIPVSLDEFCGNYLQRIQNERNWLLEHLPRQQVEEEGYITIEGKRNIQDKIRNLLKNTKERVYMACTVEYLKEYEEELLLLSQEKKKVVILTDQCWEKEGVVTYVAQNRGNQIGLITDSRYVLSGEYGIDSQNTCLYSGQKNFVMLFKSALANEIKLIQLQGGEFRNE